MRMTLKNQHPRLFYIYVLFLFIIFPVASNQSAWSAEDDSYPIWSYNAANKQRLSASELKTLMPLLESTTDPYLLLGINKTDATLVQARIIRVLYINALNDLHVHPLKGWTNDRILAAIAKVKGAFQSILNSDGRKLLGVTRSSTGHYSFIDEVSEWDLAVVPLNLESVGGVKIRRRLLSMGPRGLGMKITGDLNAAVLRAFRGDANAAHNFYLEFKAKSPSEALSYLKAKVGPHADPKALAEIEQILTSGPTAANHLGRYVLALIAKNIEVMPYLERILFVDQQSLRWLSDTNERSMEYSNALLFWESNSLSPTDVAANNCELAVSTGIMKDN